MIDGINGGMNGTGDDEDLTLAVAALKTRAAKIEAQLEKIRKLMHGNGQQSIPSQLVSHREHIRLVSNQVSWAFVVILGVLGLIIQTLILYYTLFS